MSLFDLITQGTDIEIIIEFIAQNPSSVTELHPLKQTPALLELLTQANNHYFDQQKEILVKKLADYTENFINLTPATTENGFSIILNSICLAIHFTQLSKNYNESLIFFITKYTNIAQTKPTPDFFLVNSQQAIIDHFWKILLNEKLNAANSLVIQNKLEDAISLYLSLLNQTDPQTPTKTRAAILRALGQCHETNKKLEAIEFFINAADLHVQMEDLALAKFKSTEIGLHISCANDCYKRIGTLYKSLGNEAKNHSNYENAYDYFTKAKNWYEKAEKLDQQKACFSLAQECYFQMLRRAHQQPLSHSQELSTFQVDESSRARLIQSI